MTGKKTEQTMDADQEEIFLVCKSQGNGTYGCRRIPRDSCSISANPPENAEVAPAVVPVCDKASDNDNEVDIDCADSAPEGAESKNRVGEV